MYESGPAVGGLSRTIEKNGFRFDLGGHRFFTRDIEIEEFVRQLMGSELLSVHRSSRIYMREKYFDYPLKPFNAMFGLGIPTTVKILSDYLLESVGRVFKKKEIISLEDWVVSRFGRTMFELYFKNTAKRSGVSTAREYVRHGSPSGSRDFHWPRRSKMQCSSSAEETLPP